MVNRSLETAEVVMLADIINASKLPDNDMGWRYWYGGFPKDDVINFVQLRDGNAEAVIKNATWFDIDDIKLAGK